MSRQPSEKWDDDDTEQQRQGQVPVCAGGSLGRHLTGHRVAPLLFHMQQQEQQHQHSSTLPPPSVPARPTALDGGSSRLTCASPSPIIATAGAGANGAEPAEFPFGAARAPSSTVTTPKTTSFVSSSRTLGVTTEQRQRHLDEQQQFGDKRET